MLTEEALGQHDKLFSAKELRQFACKRCDNVWWRVVLPTKKVSKCKKCFKKYDALPRDKEYGMGRFACSNCLRVFYSRCYANTECKCYKCGAIVSKPYIDPHNKGRTQERASNPRYSRHSCNGKGKCPLFQKVLYASEPHISSGSTIDTWISQLGDTQASESLSFDSARHSADLSTIPESILESSLGSHSSKKSPHKSSKTSHNERLSEYGSTSSRG